jgi:hypothetical protein
MYGERPAVWLGSGIELRENGKSAIANDVHTHVRPLARRFGPGTEAAEPAQPAGGRNAAFERALRTFYSAASTLPDLDGAHDLPSTAVLERVWPLALTRSSAESHRVHDVERVRAVHAGVTTCDVLV